MRFCPLQPAARLAGPFPKASGYASDGEAAARRQPRQARRVAKATEDRATSPVAIPGVEVLVNGVPCSYAPSAAAADAGAAAPAAAQQASLAEAVSQASAQSTASAYGRASGLESVGSTDAARRSDGGGAEGDEDRGQETNAGGSERDGSESDPEQAGKGAPDAHVDVAGSVDGLGDVEGGLEGTEAPQDTETAGAAA